MEKRLLQEMRFMMERLESPRMTDTELTKKRNKLNEIMGPMDQKTFERLTSEMTNSIDTYESASRKCDAQSGPPGDPHSGGIYKMCMQNVEYPKDKLKNYLAEWKRIDSKFQYMDDNIAQKLMRFFSKSSKEDLANV